MMNMTQRVKELKIAQALDNWIDLDKVKLEEKSVEVIRGFNIERVHVVAKSRRISAEYTILPAEDLECYIDKSAVEALSNELVKEIEKSVIETITINNKGSNY